MGSIVSIGVDIGQKVDPTAIAVVEAVRKDGEWAFLTRYLERLALGTPFKDVSLRTSEVVAGVRERMIDDGAVARGRLERGGISRCTWMRPEWGRPSSRCSRNA
ncbi:MAG: hypothetical protein M3275_08480 [Thermoproteota archaeon]|nr:hypothetical protein [Thermoproteota archaeon]